MVSALGGVIYEGAIHPEEKVKVKSVSGVLEQHPGPAKQAHLDSWPSVVRGDRSSVACQSAFLRPFSRTLATQFLDTVASWIGSTVSC